MNAIIATYLVYLSATAMHMKALANTSFSRHSVACEKLI